MRLTLCLVAAFAFHPAAAADDPPRVYSVISPKPVGIIATGINGKGDVVGFEWVEEKDNPDVVSQVPFFAKGGRQVTIPLMKSYTMTSPAAVSDDGLVVGHVGKAAPPNVRVRLRMQAFVWDEKGGIRGLGALPDDWLSYASGVSRDGKRISGYSVGDSRVRACVWDRAGDEWKATALPGSQKLGSNVVPISDDGDRVAGVEAGSPCLWSRDKGGTWTREMIGEAGSLVARGVNNSGMVVGVVFTGDGLRHATVWTRAGGVVRLEKPKGYIGSEAKAVNNWGTVVGVADGPRGSEVGPDPFLYENQKIRLITEGGPKFAEATAVNDRGQVAGVLETKEEAEPAPRPGP